MTSKERVLEAIKHKETDRIPRFFWISEGAASNIMRESNIHLDEIDDFMGNDIKQTWLSINKQMSTMCDEGARFIDEWGITWERQAGYNMVVKHPLAGLCADEIAAAHLPDPYDSNRYTDLKAKIAKYGDTYFIGADVSGTLFEPAYHLRGMEELMLDMASESKEADVLLDRLCDFSMKVAVEAVRLGVDWVWLGDDMGTQLSMLISYDMWCKYFKPRMKKIIDAVHAQRSNMIIAYHSCGSIFPIISDLAQIGINVLNPLQESAVNMEHRIIKDKYGDVLTFMCGLDTQTFLVNASYDEVFATMKEKAEIMKNGGGYIAAVSHTIQHDIPVKNIVAMVDALNSL